MLMQPKRSTSGVNYTAGGLDADSEAHVGVQISEVDPAGRFISLRNKIDKASKLQQSLYNS